MRTILHLAVLATVAASGCADKREGPAAITLVTWKDDVAAVVGARCATSGCHAGDAPQASYDLTTYQGALGRGSDLAANAIAGDAGSLILTELDTLSHVGVADVLPLLRAWVVDSNLAYERSRIHGPGLLDPASAEFHGTVLKDLGWKFAVCQRCHGKNFAGNTEAPSCLTCHARGPTACETCHGTGPTSGAHPRHASRGYTCSECHTVPTAWDEPGHILDASGQPIPLPARVELGAFANRDLPMPRRTMPATYDPATGTCSAVYCHGGILGDASAANPRPTWNGGAAAAACGSCHGKPPATHPPGECVVCHPGTIDPAGTLAAAHVDGVIDVGNNAGTCAACHGSGVQPAPPRGLHGEQFTVDLAVGAHRVHLEANRLRGPVACAECHRVPTTVAETGHIDTALPAELTFGTLATTDGAAPTWDRQAATCSNVYCHGGGTRLAADASPGKLVAPRWTASSSATIYCGACHGVPPADASHAPTLQLGDCVTCHARTVDGFGNIVLSGPSGAQTSQHMDGDVDVF